MIEIHPAVFLWLAIFLVLMGFIWGGVSVLQDKKERADNDRKEQ